MLNWGRHNAQCLPVWKQSGPMLSLGCAHVGPSRAHVEPSWAHLGLMLGQVGPMLSPYWPRLGLCWAHLGPTLGLCWADVGRWAYVGPCWAILGATLGPCLGHLCWNDLKMPIFAPQDPSWSPKPRKNRGFVTSPKWNPLPPKGPKHRKKTDVFFLTPQATYTVNCRDMQGLQFTRSRSGVNITFGYHRSSSKDTGSVASARF